MKHVKLMKNNGHSREQALPETDVNSVIGLDDKLKKYDKAISKLNTRVSQLENDKKR